MSLENLHLLCYSWMGVGIIAFILLQFINAPYGKFSSNAWGPTIDNRTGWVIMEAIVIVFFLYYSFRGGRQYGPVEWVFIGLFLFHYANRGFIFPFRTKTKGKRMPILISLLGVGHNWVNCFLLGSYLNLFASYDTSWFGSPQFIIGIILFITGMVINWQSDNILINLRDKPGDGYKIPQGGLFKYISCPNLMGEIIEWLGFAIMMWALPGFAFVVFTVCNLLPRALSSHKWYKSYFADYPKNRKAIIPGIL